MNNISPVRYNIQTYQNPNYSQNLITTPSFKGNITQKIFTNKKAGFPIIASILAFIGFSTKNKSVEKPAEEVNVNNKKMFSEIKSVEKPAEEVNVNNKKMFSEIKSAATNKRNKDRETIYQKYNREYEALCIKTTGRICEDLNDTAYKEYLSNREKTYLDLISLSNKNSKFSKAKKMMDNGEISQSVYNNAWDLYHNIFEETKKKDYNKYLEIADAIRSLKNKRDEALKKVDDEYEETINAAKSKYNITETHKEKPKHEKATGTKLEPEICSSNYYSNYYSNPFRETANYQSCYVLHGQNYGVFSEREIRRNWH